MVVENGWSGFTFAGETCYFKHSLYHLKPKWCRRTNPAFEIHIYAHHKAYPASTLGKWEWVKDKDIAGQGDVGNFPRWE